MITTAFGSRLPCPTIYLQQFFEQSLPDAWRTACRKESRLTTPWIDIRNGTLGIRKEWQKIQREQEGTVDNLRGM